MATIGSPHWTSRHLAFPDLSQPVLLREISLRRRGAEQCTCLGLVVGDCSHGKVSVPQPLRIMFDAQIEAPQPQVQPNPAHLVHSGLDKVLRIEAPGWLDRETRSSIAAGLASQKPAFERVHLLEIDAALAEEID